MAPDNRSARRIAIENLKPGMVLARDLHDPDGNIVLRGDTVLDKDNFNTIILNSSSYVYVLDESIVSDRKGFLDTAGSAFVSPVDVPLSDRGSFKGFTTEYGDKPSKLASAFSRLAEGKNVSRDELYSITDDLMRHLHTKTDVILYINYLETEADYLYIHSINVALFANLFGIWINLDSNELADLTVAALLHDIGKSQLPLEIVSKRSPLTKEEEAVMKKHPTLGYRILDRANMLDEIKYAALSHHERSDGSGFPLGLKSEKISRYAKIIAICDAYEQMVAEGILSGLRDPSPFDVIKKFERESFGLFDTESLLLFLHNIAYTFLNSRVQLSDGSSGYVAFISPDDLSKPIVVTDEKKILDMRRHPDIRIASLAY